MKKGPTIVIDYAHTADAFFHTLQTVKACGAKKIIHIFTDFMDVIKQKREEEIVRVSTEFSDELILTLDDF